MLKKILLLISAAVLLLQCVVSAATGGLTINDIKYTDVTNSPISTLISYRCAVSNVNLTNQGETETTVSVIAALYDGAGNMKSFSTSKAVLGAGETKTLSAGVIVPPNADIYRNYSLKTFVWEDLLAGHALAAESTFR